METHKEENNIYKVEIKSIVDNTPCKEAKILKDGFIKAVCEMSGGNPQIDSIKKKFELKESEGYSVRFIRLGEASIRQYFVNGFVSAILRGRIERGQFVGSVEINTTIMPKNSPKTEEIAVNWTEMPNLGIKITVK